MYLEPIKELLRDDAYGWEASVWQEVEGKIPFDAAVYFDEIQTVPTNWVIRDG